MAKTASSTTKKSSQEIKPHHEVMRESNGMHRIVLGGVHGPWFAWTMIASFTVGSITYRACTSYYEGTLPVGQVFTVKVVS